MALELLLQSQVLVLLGLEAVEAVMLWAVLLLVQVVQAVVEMLAQQVVIILAPTETKTQVEVEVAVLIKTPSLKQVERAAQESWFCVYPILLRRYSQVVSLLVLILYRATTFTKCKAQQQRVRQSLSTLMPS